MSELQQLERSIERTMIAERFRLRRLVKSIRAAKLNNRPFDQNLAKLTAQINKSVTTFERRLENVPRVVFDQDLPILERRDEIAAAIQENQVIVVCGETGSGKSTQLPKIALSLGRGVGGLIGHTQPRRIAARSVASRLADELGTTVGDQVGFRIRFSDATGPNTYIKLMTDGILLAESQSDRFLDRYDTIIIDEAHERSLNIDILIGYIKRLLVRRRDLRLIITSATIDAERFSDHFSRPGHQAPIIEVSGRTYPVELRYRSLVDDDGADRDWPQGIIDALEELAVEGRGDSLVFLPTERDIREMARQLRGHTQQSPALRGTEVLPLYGRMSTADQNRVFQAHQARRVVLATNVAESSLTVPGIRYVIDTGTARISRYSIRSRIQRLPIEPVSQASADQRKGRCGRIGPGICIRLFDEADFNSREPFTPPEIQRTSLAAVLLQMMSLKLGAIEEFPFLDPPKPTAIREGYKTLFELGAIDEANQLTETGRSLSRMPVDPRIGRMILAGIEEHCLPEILIIASAL
jgi:ATP-dependent helicase HrpA